MHNIKCKQHTIYTWILFPFRCESKNHEIYEESTLVTFPYYGKIEGEKPNSDIQRFTTHQYFHTCIIDLYLTDTRNKEQYHPDFQIVSCSNCEQIRAQNVNPTIQNEVLCVLNKLSKI